MTSSEIIANIPVLIFKSSAFWFSLSIGAAILALLVKRYRPAWFVVSIMIVMHTIAEAAAKTQSLPILLGAATPFFFGYAALQLWTYFKRTNDKATGPKTDLIESVEILSNVFRQLPLGCIVLDRSCTIIEVNTALASDFGYTPSELVGLHVNALLPSESQEGHQDKVQSIIDGTRKPTGWRDVTGKHKNGSAVKIRLSVKPLSRGVFSNGPALGIGMTEMRDAG